MLFVLMKDINWQCLGWILIQLFIIFIFNDCSSVHLHLKDFIVILMRGKSITFQQFPFQNITYVFPFGASAARYGDLIDKVLARLIII